MTDIAYRVPAKSETQVEARKARLEQELARYVQLLVAHRQPEKVIVFGSLTTGDIHSWSDIDLVVVEATELLFMQRLHWIRALLQPTIATDILAYTPEELEPLRKERPFVRDEILSKGRVVYERLGALPDGLPKQAERLAQSVLDSITRLLARSSLT